MADWGQKLSFYHLSGKQVCLREFIQESQGIFGSVSHSKIFVYKFSINYIKCLLFSQPFMSQLFFQQPLLLQLLFPT